MARGVWFEESRNRWRVRLYYNGHVVHRSYHPDEDEAMDVHKAAKEILKSMTLAEKQELIKPSVKTDSLSDLLNGLKAVTRKKPTLTH